MKLFDHLKQRAVQMGMADVHVDDAIDIIRIVKQIPYGRARDRAGETIITQWRGTCSGKHYLLKEILAEIGYDFQLVHRVYVLSPIDGATLFSPRVVACMPSGGLTDVHTYGWLEHHGRCLPIDVTFPGDWDGVSSMPLACGDGQDFSVPVGVDPQALKEALIAQHCVSEDRERFIAALSM